MTDIQRSELNPFAPDNRGRPNGWGACWNRADLIRVGLALTLFSVLVFIAADGPRGTDQYWYVADAASLANEKGVETNAIYPLVLERNLSLPRPFIHNIVPVYVAGTLAILTGPYSAWILLNILCTVATSVLIYVATRRLSTHRRAMYAGILYLFLPPVFWQATQPLAEASIAVGVALAVCVVLWARGHSILWGSLAVVSSLLFYTRHTFLAILVFLPVAAAWQALRQRHGKTRASATIGCLSLFAAAVVAAEPHLFPPYLDYGYIEAVNGAAAGDLLFSEPPDRFRLSVIWDQAQRALLAQFGGGSVAQFLLFAPFNVMAAATLILPWVDDRPRSQRLFVVAIAALALHLVTAVLYRNQFRYTVTVMPPLIVATAVSLDRVPRSWQGSVSGTARRLSFGVVLLFSILACGWAASASRDDAQQDRKIRSSLQPLSREIPADAPLAVDYGDTISHRWTLVGFVYRDRPVLYLHPQHHSPADALRYRQETRAEYLLAGPNSSFRTQGCVRQIKGPSLPPPYGTLHLYHCPLPARGSSSGGV